MPVSIFKWHGTLTPKSAAAACITCAARVLPMVAIQPVSAIWRASLSTQVERITKISVFGCSTARRGGNVRHFRYSQSGDAAMLQNQRQFR